MIWIAAYLYVAGAIVTMMEVLDGVRRPIAWRVAAAVVLWPLTIKAIVAVALIEAARDAARKTVD